MKGQISLEGSLGDFIGARRTLGGGLTVMLGGPGTEQPDIEITAWATRDQAKQIVAAAIEGFGDSILPEKYQPPGPPAEVEMKR